MPKILWLLIVASAVPLGALGQECTQVVPVTILDRDTDAPVWPLPVQAFQARSGNTNLPIAALERVRTGRLIVLIDESGSMREAPTDLFSYQGRALRLVKQTLSDLVGQLPPGVSAEYGLFNKKCVFSENFLAEPKELRQSMDEVAERFGRIGVGQTALYDSVGEALKRFGTPQPGDTILLLTDGEDNHSELSAKDLKRKLRASHARLLTILVRRGEFGLITEAPDNIRDLALHSGGTSLLMDTTNPSWTDKEGSLRNVDAVRRFWNQWVLGGFQVHLQVPATVKKDAKWKLSVNPGADPRLKRAIVLYPDRLDRCPESSR